MAAAMEADQIVSLPSVDPFVDGTAVGRAGELPYSIVKELVDDILVVP